MFTINQRAMALQLQPLLINPCLSEVTYQALNSNSLTKRLAMPLWLPKKPFIFSCFALSVDGKLCYPDQHSGFAIAQCNYAATHSERELDWWLLNLARTISDAVIIGRNSLSSEKFNFSAEITFPELQLLRHQLAKPKHLLHIVLSRDGSSLDLTQEFIAQQPEIPLLVVVAKLPQAIPAQFKVVNQLQLTERKQILVLPDLDLNRLIRWLHQGGITTILNESPYCHHHLQQLQLLNEAWLNTSGVYIGGNPVATLGQTQASFTSDQHPHYTLLTLHHHRFNFLYARYRLDYDAKPN